MSESIQEKYELLAQELKEERREKNRLKRELMVRDDLISSFKRSAAFQENLHNIVKKQRDEQELFLNLMLEESRDLIVLMDKNMKFITGTRENLRKIGLNTDALHDTDFVESMGRVLSAESHERLHSHVKAAFDTGETLEYTARTQLKNGDAFYHTSTFIPFKDEGGGVIGVMLQIHDVTKLQAAIDEAKLASEAKSSFLATMSHEIRTPMNAIIGITQIQLQNDHLPDDYAEALEKIHTSGNTLLAIINDILDMGKIETGKMELNPITYDVASLIHDAVQLNVVRIGSKPIKFRLKIDENLPSRLIGDELRLKQILNNILSNSFKYTDKGYVRMGVSATLAGEDALLKFIVKDSGQGMKAEDLERLFSEYSRFNKEANSATEGTGLGLNITQKLVALMDGTIEVDSEYQKGSEFRITVRQQCVDCPVIGAQLAQSLCDFSFSNAKQKTKLRITKTPMPYGKVLIVDDVETNLFVAKGLMSPYKLNIDMADSGFRVLDLVKAGTAYDIIFMDHMMPQMDGIETTRQLREMGYTGIVVALTANALAGSKEMFSQNGFDGFISKPIDIRQLNALLNKFIRDKYPEEAQKYAAAAPGHPAPDPATDTTPALDPKLIQIFCRDARKAVDVLQATMENADYKLYTITAHAMKSALANIGEQQLSERAYALEQAGHKNDISVISSDTAVFVDKLRALLERFEPGENVPVATAPITEDRGYLQKELGMIAAACADYDDSAAYAGLDRLKEKTWTAKTATMLEDVRDILYLHSDFEQAAALLQTFMGDLDL